MRSILAKLRSISLFASGGISTPNLESSNCSLKKLVEGGSNPSMSLLAKVTAKKVVAKQRAKGTSQLATKKPAAGGLRGVQTQQGVNTGQAAAPTKQTA